jgi:hypothetical protein
MESEDRPDPRQLAIFGRMSAHEKLELVGRLRDDAPALKAAWLRQQHSDEGEEGICARLRS